MTALLRVFAGELSRAALQTDAARKHGPPYIITPSGARGSCLLLAGALTRVEKLPGEFLKSWVADPTGTFTLIAGKQDEEVISVLEHADPPVFVLVSGEIVIPRNGRNEITVRPLVIRVVDRTIRDSWTIVTAEQSLKRLEIMTEAIRHGTDDPQIKQAITCFHSDNRQLRELVEMVELALSKVNHVPGGPVTLPDPREKIIELIKINSGPKGVTLSDLVPLAAREGIGEDQVIATIRKLVEEDECYQPSAGAIKLL